MADGSEVELTGFQTGRGLQNVPGTARNRTVPRTALVHRDRRVARQPRVVDVAEIFKQTEENTADPLPLKSSEKVTKYFLKFGGYPSIPDL